MLISIDSYSRVNDRSISVSTLKISFVQKLRSKLDLYNYLDYAIYPF